MQMSTELQKVCYQISRPACLTTGAEKIESNASMAIKFPWNNQMSENTENPAVISYQIKSFWSDVLLPIQ